MRLSVSGPRGPIAKSCRRSLAAEVALERHVDCVESLPPADARAWARVLASYRKSDNRGAAYEISVTLVPFVILWGLSAAALEIGYWLMLLLAVPTAGFLVRLFIIQHDCGHGSFFCSRRMNDWTGRLLGVLTMTPYRHWQRGHAIHHATSGRLTQRGHGDIYTLTVREYQAMGPVGRFSYRVFRHPLVLFVVGPAYLFYLHNRLPFGQMGDWRSWISTLGTTLSMAAGLVLTAWFLGPWTVLLVHAPVTFLGASIGVWLFFVQHQFEHTTWSPDADWDWHEAALHGSSNYDLPPVLRWMTGNIGLHHIHHLCSRIPFYRLPIIVRDHPGLGDIGRLGFIESLSCVKLTLWDEEKGIMVPFGSSPTT